jgi:hypothetical protein
MNPSIFEVYAPRGDGGEHGLGPAMGYYSTIVQAETKAKNSGWWGGYGGVSTHFAVMINGEVFLLAQADPIDLDNVRQLADEELRAKTLAQLTPDQKRVLGLETK